MEVTGGAVQGSVLGVLDHNAVLNDLDTDLENSPSLYTAKYVDDMTLIDTVDSNTLTNITTTETRPLHTFTPPQSQQAFRTIKRRAEEKSLKINETKTQLLSVSSARFDTLARIETEDGETIESGNTLKMLGFVFSNKPTVNAQVENLIRKANKRYFALIKYKRAGINKTKLKEIFISIMRSVVEFSAVVYHSQLNKQQTELLEKVQKRSLRLIYGFEKDYKDLLAESGLPTLEARREEALAKFTHKMVKNPRYASWFPLRNIVRQNRNTKPYLEETSVGNRLYCSPIYAMRRLLNDSITEEGIDIAGLFELP